MKNRIHCLFALVLACCMAGLFNARAVDAAGRPAGAREMSLSEGRKAIEKFMGLTSLWIIELEWTFGHDNRTPSADDRAKAMLAADVSTCPPDFQEAWLMQVQNPRRNYIAPVLRKYGVKLADVREEVQDGLKSIDSSVRPPVPLYDEEETPGRYDPTACGSRNAILAAVTKLRAKMNGIDPSKAVAWKKAVHTVMLAFSLNYMETFVCMNVAGIPRGEVAAMFDAIDVKACPPDFVEAWRHDLPSFKQGEFAGTGLRVPVLCRKYGVDEESVLNEVKRKMAEWEIKMPDLMSQVEFRKQMKHLKSNLLDHR